MSRWSISAMSPRRRCLTSSFVRLPGRTGPATLSASAGSSADALERGAGVLRGGAWGAGGEPGVPGTVGPTWRRVPHRSRSGHSCESNARGRRAWRLQTLRRRGAARARGGAPRCRRRRRRAFAPARPPPRARRAAPRSSRVGPSPVSLTIEKWRSPSEAICGRWVMHSTCLRSPSSRSRAPTARAVWPPMPRRPRRTRASPRPRTPPATLMIASITRESSPPEAISRSGPAGTPGFGAIMNSTGRRPRARLALAEHHLEARVAHRQRRQLLAHGRRETPAALARALRNAPACRARARPAPRPAAPSRAPARPPRPPAPRGARGRARRARARPRTLPPCLRVSRSSAARRSSSASSETASPSWPSTPSSSCVAAARSSSRSSPARSWDSIDSARSRSASASSAGSTPASASSRAAAERRELRRAADSPRSGASASAPAPAAERSASRRRSRSRAPSSSLVLLLVRVERVDLRQLVLEQVELPLALRGAARAAPAARSSSSSAADVRVRARAQARRVLAARRRRRGSRSWAAGERQLAVLVLAVEGEQRSAELAQVADRRGAAVQVGARAPVGADAAREDELLGVRRVRRSPSSARSPLGQRRRRPRRRPRPRPGARSPAARAPPSSRSSAWASTVLPAPVSPVSTFRPGASRSCARSISSRFSTRSSCSTPAGLPAHGDGSVGEDRASAQAPVTGARHDLPIARSLRS